MKRDDGSTYYTYSDPAKSAKNAGSSSLQLVNYEDLGIKTGSVAAIVHTHGQYRHDANNRFTRTDDGSFNNIWAWRSNRYEGLYLVAPNGTLQFWAADAPISDTMIRVVSTNMPKQASSPAYTPGSEQLYVKKERHWTYYINPFHWGKPKTYYEAVD